jgi:hypothetical protein
MCSYVPIVVQMDIVSGLMFKVSGLMFKVSGLMFKVSG